MSERQPVRPFGRNDKAVWKDRTLPTGVKTIYAYLTIYCGTEREAYPSRQTISDDTGMALRTVDKYVALGEAAGLFVVVRDKTDAGLNKVNRYRIQDFEDFTPGKGQAAPKVKRKRWTKPTDEQGVAQTLHHGVAQDLHHGGAKSAPEHDHVTGPPPNTTRSTHPRDAHAVPRSQANAATKMKLTEPTEVVLRLPADFETMPAPQVWKWAAAASVAAMAAADRPLGKYVGARIGSAAKKHGDDRHRLLQALRSTLQAALDGSPTLAWMFEDQPDLRRAPIVLLDNDHEEVRDEYSGTPGADGCIDAMEEKGYHPYAVVNTINKTHQQMDAA